MTEGTLRKLQDYVKQTSADRGFDSESPSEKVMLLLEEAGELAKAIRKFTGVKVDKSSAVHSVEEEVADVLYVLLDLCNQQEVDIAAAFKAKEETKNKTRNWH